MNINKEIGLKVKACRRRLKYSQENIADLLNMSRANYVNMEQGRIGWQTIYIYNLCRIFKCTPTKLFPAIDPIEVVAKIVKKRIITIKNKKQFKPIR